MSPFKIQLSVPYFVKCKRGDTSYTVGMTRIVRLVSLVPPLISIWGGQVQADGKPSAVQSHAHSLRYARSYAYVLALFQKKALRFKRNNLKTKPKIFSPILSRVNRCRALPFARAIRPWKMACLRQVV